MYTHQFLPFVPAGHAALDPSPNKYCTPPVQAEAAARERDLAEARARASAAEASTAAARDELSDTRATLARSEAAHREQVHNLTLPHFCMSTVLHSACTVPVTSASAVHGQALPVRSCCNGTIYWQAVASSAMCMLKEQSRTRLREQ